MGQRIVIFSLAIVALLAIAFWPTPIKPAANQPLTGQPLPAVSEQCQPSDQTCRLQIGHHIFTVNVARTTLQQTKGIGGVDTLEPDQGMYFPLEGRQASFWMKGMVIPIDILWIDQSTIVAIDYNAQPEPGVPDEQLKRYPGPVNSPDGVLEIAAGQSEELGIKAGDKVEWVE